MLNVLNGSAAGNNFSPARDSESSGEKSVKFTTVTIPEAEKATDAEINTGVLITQTVALARKGRLYEKGEFQYAYIPKELFDDELDIIQKSRVLIEYLYDTSPRHYLDGGDFCANKTFTFSTKVGSNLVVITDGAIALNLHDPEKFTKLINVFEAASRVWGQRYSREIEHNMRADRRNRKVKDFIKALYDTYDIEGLPYEITTLNELSEGGQGEKVLNIQCVLWEELGEKGLDHVYTKMKQMNTLEMIEEPILYKSIYDDGAEVWVMVPSLSTELITHGVEKFHEAYQDVKVHFPEDVKPKSVGMILMYGKVLRNAHAAGNIVQMSVRPRQEFVITEEDEKTFRHELIHASLFDIWGNNPSEWLTEGMAMYYGSHKGSLRFDGNVKRRMKEDLERIDEYLDDDEMFEYYGGQFLIAFIEGHYGKDTVFDFYRVACSMREKLPIGISEREKIQRILKMYLPIGLEDFTSHLKEFISAELVNEANLEK